MNIFVVLFGVLVRNLLDCHGAEDWRFQGNCYAPKGCHIIIDASIRPSIHPKLFCPEHNFKTMQGKAT